MYMLDRSEVVVIGCACWLPADEDEVERMDSPEH